VARFRFVVEANGAKLDCGLPSVVGAVAVLLMSHEENALLNVRDGKPQTGGVRTMRATRLSVANYKTTLSSDSLESGTGSSNPPRSPKQS
jgi:hypothetical protein